MRTAVLTGLSVGGEMLQPLGTTWAISQNVGHGVTHMCLAVAYSQAHDVCPGELENTRACGLQHCGSQEPQWPNSGNNLKAPSAEDRETERAAPEEGAPLLSQLHGMKPPPPTVEGA